MSSTLQIYKIDKPSKLDILIIILIVTGLEKNEIFMLSVSYNLPPLIKLLKVKTFDMQRIQKSN